MTDATLIGGLYVFIMFGGVQSQIDLPIILVGDAAFALFLRSLWRRYSAPPRPLGSSFPDRHSSSTLGRRSGRLRAT